MKRFLPSRALRELLDYVHNNRPQFLQDRKALAARDRLLTAAGILYGVGWAGTDGINGLVVRPPPESLPGTGQPPTKEQMSHDEWIREKSYRDLTNAAVELTLAAKWFKVEEVDKPVLAHRAGMPATVKIRRFVYCPGGDGLEFAVEFPDRDMKQIILITGEEQAFREVNPVDKLRPRSEKEDEFDWRDVGAAGPKPKEQPRDKAGSDWTEE